MRKLIWQATILVLCGCAAFSWMAPAASAQESDVDQDGALEVTVVDGECFIATSTSEIVITVTDIIDEYESREIQTGTEVFSEELIPADCPEVIVDEVLGLAIRFECEHASRCGRITHWCWWSLGGCGS